MHQVRMMELRHQRTDMFPLVSTYRMPMAQALRVTM